MIESWLDESTRRYGYRQFMRLVGIPNNERHIKFSAISRREALREIQLGSVPWIEAASLGRFAEALPFSHVPAPFIHAKEGALLEQGQNGEFNCRIDLPSLTAFMLTRLEERVDQYRDERGRFPAQMSFAYRAGFLDRPIVDEWALLVRKWLESSSTWRASTRSFVVVPTHDIDSLLRFSKPSHVVTRTIGATRRRPYVGAALREFATGVVSRAQWRLDPYVRAIGTLLEMSDRYNWRSVFFVKTAESGPFDSGHDLRSAVGRRLIDQVRERGHELGFHPGYAAFDSVGTFWVEAQRFRKCVGPSSAGIRQHNLRFDARSSWKLWDAAGFAYDSTVGYPERAGFRCGTCQPFQIFDVDQRLELKLVERPLIAMDTTLLSKRYEGLNPEQAYRRLADLGEACRRVNGEFVLLWHNSSFSGSYDGWESVYQRILERFA